MVCHHCDNPRCVNPKHLFLGTYKDNRIDCIQKGRANLPTGAQHHHSAAKLTESDAKEIKILLSKGYKHQIIAKQFDVCQPQISKINTGRQWSHI